MHSLTPYYIRLYIVCWLHFCVTWVWLIYHPATLASGKEPSVNLRLDTERLPINSRSYEEEEEESPCLWRGSEPCLPNPSADVHQLRKAADPQKEHLLFPPATRNVNHVDKVPSRVDAVCTRNRNSCDSNYIFLRMTDGPCATIGVVGTAACTWGPQFSDYEADSIAVAATGTEASHKIRRCQTWHWSSVTHTSLPNRCRPYLSHIA